jgi:hypothetical protein
VAQSPNPGARSNNLSDIAVVAADDVWAVGQYTTEGFSRRTLIVHWDGQEWTQVSSPNVGPDSGLNKISVLSANDIWAVGTYFINFFDHVTLVEHWDGTSWTHSP